MFILKSDWIKIYYYGFQNTQKFLFSDYSEIASQDKHKLNKKLIKYYGDKTENLF